MRGAQWRLIESERNVFSCLFRGPAQTLCIRVFFEQRHGHAVRITIFRHGGQKYQPIQKPLVLSSDPARAKTTQVEEFHAFFELKSREVNAVNWRNLHFTYPAFGHEGPKHGLP